jgi:hypothetical protein
MLRPYVTTSLSVLAGLGLMTSPIWFSKYVSPANSRPAPAHVAFCQTGPRHLPLTMDRVLGSLANPTRC